MSPVDTAWLRMDRENHLMAIKGVLVLSRSLALADVQRLLTQRLVRHFPRFTQCVRQDENGAWWETDVHFDVRRHLRRRRLGAGDPQQRLQDLLGRLAAEPLPSDRPLWSVELVAPYREGCALVVRLHHCMADGMALLALMRCLCDPLQTPDDGAVRHPGSSSESSDAQDPPWLVALARWAQDPQASVELGQWGGRLAADMAKLWVLPVDSTTRLKGRTGRRKSLAWSQPLPLPTVKAAARALGCTVNDLMLCCVAGALRRHLLDQGDAVDGVSIRTLVPVSLRHTLRGRSAGRDAAMGNRFGLVPLLLPLHQANPLARVQTIRHSMHALKSSLLPPLSLGLLGVMGLAPRTVQSAALDLLASKATAVVTHVPGPRHARYLGGARIDEVMFWVPQSGDVGLGVSIFSYADQVRFGLIADAGLVPAPEQVMPLVLDEFDRVLMTLLLCADTPLPSAQAFEARLQVWVEGGAAAATTGGANGTPLMRRYSSSARPSK